MKAMKVSKYFEIQRSEYSYIELTPVKSNKNNHTSDIAKVINQLYMKLSDRFIKEEKKMIFKTNQKVSYYIHIKKEKVRFFFIIPSVHLNIFKSKISEIWKYVKIQEVDGIPFMKDSEHYYLKYTHNESLSLDVDKRNNDLLNANLSILEILDNTDEVGILYNFIPTSERESRGFRYNYINAIEKYKLGNDLKNTKSIKDITISLLKGIISFIDELLGQKQSLFLTNIKELSSSSKKKGKSDICKTQILISAKSKDKSNETRLIKSTTNSFNVISNDNSIVAKKVSSKNPIDIDKPILPVPYLTSSIDEVSNFIALPSAEQIDQFRNINHIDIIEHNVPKSLQDGVIRIGTVPYRDKLYSAYYSQHEQISRLGRVLLGSMGSGKTHYMTNLAKDIIADGRGLIVVDYIDKCQLANAIKDITPSDKLVEIDCSDPKQLQAFAFNELTINNTINSYDKVAIAMDKAQQIQVLLDSINDDNSQLSPRMLHYLYAAATIQFIINDDASFKDIVNCLSSVEYRQHILSQVPEELTELLQDEIQAMNDLTKTTKTGLENYDSKVDGIIDRVSWLRTNFFTKLAFTKTSENNINFVDCINQNKVVLIKIPEKKFSSKMLRNCIATFYISKIWLAKQLADNKTKTELFFDEIHHSYNCQLLLESILVECRKFNLVPTLSMHYLGQCTSKCKSSIMASGSSFLLLSGCDVKAINELKTHFERFGYDETSVSELKQYTALCLIKNEETNYSAFVAQLPA